MARHALAAPRRHSPQSTVLVAEPGPGTRIAGYRLGPLLGRGGMGDVYQALDTRLDRQVAIKFVSAERATDADAAKRLAREARITSALYHPGIVTVHDIGTHNDRPFIVMELVDGQSLASRLACGPLKVKEALHLGAQIAAALAAAHAAGVVHRDLKPQNIMLTADGRTKIVDFGLGTLQPGSMADGAMRDRTATAFMTVQGTVGYMAPEQATGRPCDMRADQFAFGAILYEMVSGRRAFERDTEIQTLADIIDTDPLPLAVLCPDAPPALVAIVTRCLQKEPVARYGSTLDLAHDLRVAAEGTPSDIQLTPTEPAPPVRGTGAARRWWLPATLVVAVAAMVMLGPWPGTQSLPLAVQAQAGTRHVAILPFLAVSGRADDQVLADGLTETLTSSLSSLERFEQRLRVVPSTEVRRERIASAKEARQAFGATLAISGALQRDDAGLRLTFNLIDSEQLVQVASRTVDLPASERQRGVQDAVAQTVAGLLELQLAPEARRAMVAGGSTAPGAYQSLALGRGYLQRFDRGVDNVNRSIEAFQQAMTADPNFALAHAAAGEAYWRKFELSRQPEWIDRAVEHTERALSIDQRLPSVHVVLAMIARGRGRYEEAAAVAARAIELDPVASDGYRELGRAHEALNRPAEAEATYRRAVAARPDDWQAYNTLGSFLIGRARWDEAIAVFNQALQLTPDNTRLHNNIGGAYFGMGRHDAAAAQWERSSAIRPTYAATSNLGTYYYRRGRYAEAARSFEQAVRLAPNNHRLWRNLGAALYWAPGEQPKAAAAYTRAIELAERERQLNPRQTTLHAELADAYSMVGRRDEALAAAAAVERLGATDAESCFNVASAYEQLGRRRDALHWLQRAVEAGYSRELIEQSPGLAALRSDAAFTDAVR